MGRVYRIRLELPESLRAECSIESVPPPEDQTRREYTRDTIPAKWETTRIARPRPTNPLRASSAATGGREVPHASLARAKLVPPPHGTWPQTKKWSPIAAIQALEILAAR